MMSERKQPRPRTAKSSAGVSGSPAVENGTAGSPFRSVLRGILAAAVSYGLFAVSVVLLTSLFLLIIGMETHTQPANYAMQVSAAFLLLSQGIGITYAGLPVTFVPLGFIFIWIILIRACGRRFHIDPRGFLAGSCVWIIFTAVLLWRAQDLVAISIWRAVLYSWLVFACGCLLTVDRKSPLFRRARKSLMQKTSATLRRTVLLGIRLAVRFLIALSVLSFVTVLIWAILNFRSMGKVISYVSMGPASAVITTAVSLGWLPNLMVWALSWLLGSGIVIGNVGVFTLWESGSTALPVIPVFGILPKSLSSQNVIIAILIIPIIIAFLLGLQTISSRRGFNLFSGRDIRQEDTELKLPGIIGQASHGGHNDGEEAGLETAADPDPGADQEDHGTTRQDYPRSAAAGTAVIAKLVDFAYAAGAFVVAIITVICVSTLFYMLSSGSLGVKNLAYVGVNLSDSLSVTGRPLVWGLLASWLLSLGIVCGQYLFDFLGMKNRNNKDKDTAHSADPQKPYSTGRTAQGGHNG